MRFAKKFPGALGTSRKRPGIEEVRSIGKLSVYESCITALPALIDRAGEPATRLFLQFFTANIRNLNARAAYGRLAHAFLLWCGERGITELHQVQPIHVVACIEHLSRERSAPTVKQHLACIRTLFHWLVTGQVIPSKPRTCRPRLRHSVSNGATAVISSPEARQRANY